MYLLPHKYNFTSIDILSLSRFYLNLEDPNQNCCKNNLLLTFAIVAEHLIVNVCPPLLFTIYAFKAWIRAPNLPRKRQTLHQLRQTNNELRK